MIESSGVTFTDEYTLDVTSFCQKNVGSSVSFLFSYNPLLSVSKHTIGGVIECENEYIKPIPKITKTEFDTTKDNFTKVGLTEENIIDANRIEITLSEEPLQFTQDEETMSMTAEIMLMIVNGEYWGSSGPQIIILEEALADGSILTKIDESDNKRYTLNLGGFSLSTTMINFAFFHFSGKMEELEPIMTNKESFDTYLKEHFNQTKTSIIRENASSNYNFTENKVYEVEYEQFEHHKPINFSNSCIKELEKGALMYNDTMPELINTSIEVIEIPFNVDNKDIFSTLPSTLKKVTVDFRNKTFDSRGNCNAIIDSKTNTLIKAFGNFTIPNTVQHIADNAFYGCGEIEELIIPDSVITIGNNLFLYGDNPKVKKIVIGKNVKSIGNNSFYYCNGVTEFEIPNNVTEIGYKVVPDNVKKLTIGTERVTSGMVNSNCTDLILKEGVKYIAPSTFKDKTSITSITLPSTLIEIEDSGNYNDGVFEECSGLTEIIIPDSVTTIGSRAFYGCTSLTSVTIPNSVTTIDYNAFASCTSLTSVTIPDSVTTIDGGTFEGCSKLKTVNIGSGINNLAANMFKECYQLNNVIIPENITIIKYQCFYECYSLTTITIPSKITEIDDYAFYYCRNLSEIISSALIAPSLGRSAFSFILDSGVLKYPKGSGYSKWISALPIAWTHEEIDVE